MGMLIDVWAAVGLEGMAQVDLDVRQNNHQSLQALAPMAYAVLQTMALRLQREGRLQGLDAAGLVDDEGRLLDISLVERPSLASLRAAL
jgi:glucosyl-3-phosphoglycerate synthase